MSPWRRRVFIFTSLALSLLLCELLVRTYFAVMHGVPLHQPSRLWERYYPELGPVQSRDFSDPSAIHDVLILGGSVLNPRWSRVGDLLRDMLEERLDRPVRVHNLAFPAHTTRDSRLKFSRIDRLPFDQVVLYHGINDLRANNVPPDLFRVDYAHYSWYAEVNTLAAHPWMDWSTLPFAIDHLHVRVRARLLPDRFVPTDAPRPEWLGYGAKVRSRAAFAENIGAIVARAKTRGIPVIAATFVHYIPDDYSLASFSEKRLAYSFSPLSRPIELWGRPRDVAAGLALHNRTLRRLASRTDLQLADLARDFPADPSLFIDVCHLSERGARRFAEGLVPALLSADASPAE